MTITTANIYAVASGAKAEIVKGIVDHQHLFAKYGIRSKDMPFFMGQCAAETAGFTRLEENLYYTSAKRLMQVWPSRFKTEAAAKPYVRNPEKLANNVYASRLGNGPPSSGDGWRYRGSGMKQTTGKYNFGEVQDVTGLPVVEHPEMLRRFPEALESACIYWRKRSLGRFVDANDIVGLTKAIQGGRGGLEDRRIYTDRARRVNWEVLSVVPDMPTTAPTPITTDGGAREPVLRMGMGIKTSTHRAKIKEAQQLLQRHGFYTEGKLDGKFGGGTDNEVRAFQGAHALLPDGVIGEATWAALKADPVELAMSTDPIPHEPVDAPASSLNVDKGLVRRVQELLRERGYYLVGPLDGDAGQKTQAAILAFRNENGLPLSNEIDDELIEALQRAPDRHIPEARAEATESEIMKRDTPVAEAVRQTWWQRAIASVVGLGSMVGAFFQGVLGNLDGARNAVAPVRDFLADIPGWIWLLIIAIIAGVLYLSARKTSEEAVDLYRKDRVS